MPRPVGRPVSHPCGTVPAYKRALRYKAKGKPHCGPCEKCKAAWAKWSREYQADLRGDPKQ
jgi:hypothetical protein